MNRNKRKSKLSIMIKTPLKLKLFPEKLSFKKTYSEKLEDLFSHPPSNFGYKSDIEMMMNDLSLKKEQLFRMVITSLGRSTRTKSEVRVIASYLFLMQDFLKLLKAKNPEQKENLILKDLLTLAENVDYEKNQKDTVLMRFGEKGNNAFIILDGKVDVLIESYFNKTIGEKTYLYYLANLIKYQEYGLVNCIVNENFKKFPLEIIDDITIKYHENNNDTLSNNISTINSNKKGEQNLLKTFDIFNSNKITPVAKKGLRHSVAINPKTIDIRFSIKSIYKKFKRHNSFKAKGGNSSRNRKRQQGVFKLNYINEEIKESSTIPTYRAKELLDMFGLKINDKKYHKELNHVNTEDYIKRLNIFNNIKYDKIYLKIKKEKSSKEIRKPKPKKTKRLLKDKLNQSRKDISNKSTITEKSESLNNENSNSTEKNNSEENKAKNKSRNTSSLNSSSSSESSEFINIRNEHFIDNAKLCTYAKIISLETGALFGEMALNDPNALRKATIITSNDCHFAVLNKKIFNNSIKLGAQKHMKETLQFFLDIPIFNGIPESVFYNKYYTNLSKCTIVKGKNIINQGEKPERITLLQTGSYGLTTQISLYDLTRLILHYADTLVYNDINKKNDKDKNNKKENIKKEKNKKEEKRKDIDNLNNIQKILNEESALLAESIAFKKYYYSIQHLRITEIYSPEVILNDEFLDENGVYAFTIEAKAPENIIYTLNNKFLVDINERNISIQKNKEKFVKLKMEFMIRRLLIIRNSLISSFFDSKAKKEVGEAVIKELEQIILLNLKKKRLLNKKEEVILNTNENEKKDKVIKTNSLTKTYYRNGSDLNNENKITKISNKTKPFKSHENTKFEYEFKAKAFQKKSPDKKNKLKPLNVSLKTAIKYTTHEKDIIKTQKDKSRNRKSILLNSKNNEGGLLFSLDDLNNNKNNNFGKTNNNLSRNNGIKINLKPLSFTYYKQNTENNQINLLKTKKVLMNNLIWENIKSSGVKLPIKLNLETNNNFQDNENKYNNMINIYKTYYGHNIFHNRNIPRFYYRNNNSIYRNTSSSFDNYYQNMKIEYQNNLCYLSTKNKSKKINYNNSSSLKKENSYNSKNEQKSIHSIQNLKKSEALLKMKLKKLISPEEIQMMRNNRKLNYFMDRNKYTKIKGEKFETNRNNYYKNTIFNRMNFFYGKIDK